MFTSVADANLERPLYLDVDPRILAEDEPPPRDARDFLTGAWPDFLTRMLGGALVPAALAMNDAA